MSLVPVYGNFYENRKLSVVLSAFLEPKVILKLVRLNKKCYTAYSQESIWSILIRRYIPELRIIENDISKKENDQPLLQSNCMQIFINLTKNKA